MTPKSSLPGILLVLLFAAAPLFAEIYFEQVALINPPVGGALHFGRDVDINGNLAILGGWEEQGKAYIYHYVDGAWTLEATLKSDYPVNDDGFGWSVSISGNLAVVGNPQDEEAIPNDWGYVGAVHTFRRSPDESWPQEAKLFAPSPQLEMNFGNALDTDGQQIIVGMDSPFAWTAYAFLYEYSGGTWSHSTTFSHWCGGFDTCWFYGKSLAVDGPWIAVGDTFWDPDFHYYTDGFGAVEQFYNQGSLGPTYGEEPHDHFGHAVDVDGEFFAAGAPEGNLAGESRGYVLARSVPVTPGDSHDDQYFGYDVAMKGDVLAVTSAEYTLYLFEYNSGTSSWDEAAVIPDAGKYVAMDEEWIIVGHPDANGGIGEVRIFSISQSTVGAMITCIPSSGTLPFSTGFDIRVSNYSPLYHRRISNRIDVTIGNGQFFSSWRKGWDNYAPAVQRLFSWEQTVPNLPILVGNNAFVLNVEDVTPAPYNQPPYPMSGDTDTDSCTLLAME